MNDELNTLPPHVAEVVAAYAAKNKISTEEALEWASEGRVYSAEVGSGEVIAAVAAMPKAAAIQPNASMEEAQRRARIVIKAIAQTEKQRAPIKPIQTRAEACGPASGSDKHDIACLNEAQAALRAEEAIIDKLDRLGRIYDRALTEEEVAIAENLIPQHAAACEVAIAAWTILLKWRLMPRYR